MGTAVKVDRAEREQPVSAALVVNRDHLVTSANHAAHQLLGYEGDGLVGLSLKWISPPSQHGVLDNIHAVFTLKKPVRVNTVVLRNDGTRLDVAMLMEPSLGLRGEVTAVSVRYEPPRPSLPARALTTMPALGTVSVTARPPSSATPRRHTITPAAPRSTSVVAANDQNRESVGERLDSAVQLMRWLANLLTTPHDGTGDDARDRARMLLVLRDASELVQECRRDLEEEPAAINIPKAPRAPRIP